MKNQLKNWFSASSERGWNSLSKISDLITTVPWIKNFFLLICPVIGTKFLLLSFFLAGLLSYIYWNNYHKKTSCYSQEQLLHGKIKFLVLPWLFFLISSGWFISQSLPAKEAIILVAKFDGYENALARKYLIEELENITQDIPEIKIKPSDQVIEIEKQGVREAKKLGKTNKATLVIWGAGEKQDQEDLFDIRFTVLKPVGNFHFDKLFTQRNSLLLPKPKPEQLTTENQNISKINKSYLDINNKAYEALTITAITQAFEKDWDIAITIANQALKKIDKPINRVRMEEILAFFYLAKGDLDNARTVSNKILNQQPNNSDFVNLKGLISMAYQDYDKAEDDFKLAIKYDPDNISAHNNLGFALLEKHDYEKALEKFNNILDNKPNFIMALQNRSEIFYLKKEYQKSIEDLNQIIDLSKKETYDSLLINSYYFKRAEKHYQLQKFDDCIDDYSVIVDHAKYSQWNRFWSKVSLRSYNRIEDIDIANAHHMRGLAYIDKGVIHKNKSDFNKALEDFNKAIDLLLPLEDEIINTGFGKKSNINQLLAYYYNSRGLAYLERAKIAPEHLGYEDSDSYDKRSLLEQAILDFEEALKYMEFFTAYNNLAKTECILCQSYSIRCGNINLNY